MTGINKEWINQITLLSSIIGGFSVAIAVELLKEEHKSRLRSLVICAFVITASLLLISTSVGSQILIKMAAFENITKVPEAFASAAARNANFIAAVYYTGLGLFILGLGLAGWLQSKVVGLVTSTVAVVVGVIIVTLLYSIR